LADEGVALLTAPLNLCLLARALVGHG
jgi:hypothetical protein